MEHFGDSSMPTHARLQTSLEQGYTLPATWYTDPKLFAREKAQIFHHSWQYVGPAEQVAKPGDFFTCTVGGVPILVTRDSSGTLQAFINICRHRGCELVLQERGNGKTFQCHYHAWTYNLDGGLRNAPGMKDEEGFDKTQFSLHTTQIERWGPFLFVNLDKNATPFKSVLGALPELVAATGLNMDGIKHRVRHTYEIVANWKVVLDNYLECYHCPVAHPGFVSLIDVNNYTVTEYEYFSTQGGPQKDAGTTTLYDTNGEVKDGFYVYLWPNFTMNIYPGPGNVSLNLFVPIETNKTLAIFDYCFADAVTKEDEENFITFIDQVQQEDIILCESVQRGLGSGFFEQGKLMLHRENGLRHFQRLVYRFLEAGL